jgi:GntR family transcriptional regulator
LQVEATDLEVDEGLEADRSTATSAARSQGSLRHLTCTHELAQRFDVSRQTVRQALATLQRDGYISTQPGASSFVTYDDQDIDSGSSWSSALASRGVESTTRVLRFEMVTDADLAESLELRSDMFLALDRVRTLESAESISLERSRIPYRKQLKGLPADGLLSGSLTATLRDRGLVTSSVDEWASVVTLDAAEAHELRRAVGESFLHLRTVVRDPYDSILEHVTSWLDPAHFHLHHTYKRRNSNV